MDTETRQAENTETTIYTETTGTTTYLAGQRGTVTGLHSTHQRVVGAFVRLDGPTDADGRYIAEGPMLYVDLGAASGPRGAHHVVLDWRVIDRDEFDRLTDLDSLRRDLGWR